MRIDANATIGQYPALLVRTTLRHLRSRLPWGLAELEAAAGLTPGTGRALVTVLLSEGLIEAAGRGAWEVTQAGRTLSSATAAKPITRATAEKALQQFLGRVERVNKDPYFLGKVKRVVLFGSMLKPEVERLSDVDLAVEVTSKDMSADRYPWRAPQARAARGSPLTVARRRECRSARPTAARRRMTRGSAMIVASLPACGVLKDKSMSALVTPGRALRRPGLHAELVDDHFAAGLSACRRAAKRRMSKDVQSPGLLQKRRPPPNG